MRSGVVVRPMASGVAPRFWFRHRRTLLAAALAVAAVALGVAGFSVLVWDHGQRPGEAAAQVLVGWTFVAAGLAAARRRPDSRVGALLALAGIALLLRRLQYSDSSPVFTLAFALGEVGNVVVAHAVLAYPSGRLGSALERRLVALAYALALAFPVGTLLVYDPSLSCLFDCGSAGRPESLIAVEGDAGAFELLRRGYRVLVFAVLGAVFIGLIVRKLARASPARRRLLWPMLLAGALLAFRGVLEGALTFTTYSEPARQGLFWWQIVVQAAIPTALVAGLLRARLAHATVAEMLPQLERTPPHEIRAALARALRDPSLEVAFWLPERGAYADAQGVPVELPAEGEGRAVTVLDHEGERVAALVHDPALLEEPTLVGAAGAAARLALENARLHAELRAQLAAVRESRARIVTAGDEERRRIERNLHDGAQQRLVALALELRMAERELAATGDGRVEEVLGRAVEELQQALHELRELAQGVHPAVVSEQGLAGALEALAARCPVPVDVEAPPERLPVEAEVTAYYLACEAVTNAVKHARATAVTIRAVREDGALAVTVADDGVGGADSANGSGLRGLADRIEAVGGTLRISSPPGEGTRVIARIPCGS